MESLSDENNPEKFNHKLNIVNRVISNQGIQLTSDFKNAVNKYFGADVQIADFENNSVEETKKVNEWVRNQTNNKIQKLFDDIGKDTIILIINVLYLKGKQTINVQ